MDSLNTIITIPNIGERLVSGEKLKKARLYREFSQEELATRLGVSKQAISKYESNKSQISSDIVARLPRALGFPIKFFIHDENINENDKSIVYFRTKNIPKKTKEHLTTKIEILDKEIMGFYKKYIEFPQVNIPDLDKYVTVGKCNYDREDIIRIVKIIREEWGLDNKPIINLAYTLQSNGFILNKQYINQDKTDGLSQWIGSTPYILTSSNKEAAVRTRFDNAHELGHLILHKGISEEEQGSKAIERDADYFASEFLYPSHVFLQEIQNYPLTIDTFIQLKEKWKISIQAIVRKCLDLELISEDKYIYFQKRISYKGWRKKEPLDNIITLEEPRLLRDATELLVDNEVVSKQDILNEINLYKEDIISFCNLSENYFDETLTNIIKIY